MNLLPFTVGVLRQHWKLIALALLLATIGIQQLRVTGLKSSLRAEKAAHATTIANYRQAQADAALAALQAKQEKEAEYAKAAQDADAGYIALRSRYDSLLRAKASGGASSGASVAAKDNGSSVPEVTAAVPVAVFAMPETDWLKLPGLQAYADQCHVWALSLE
ncbi:hypothetical protein TomTYG75_07310 [Sphingobium sp. TomTYG75]